MRIFTEEQAQLLDLQTARLNVVNYSLIVANQAQQIQVLFKTVQELQQKIIKQEETLLITQEMLEQMRNARFGRSSEKRTGDTPLFDAASETKESDPPVDNSNLEGRTERPAKEKASRPRSKTTTATTSC